MRPEFVLLLLLRPADITQIFGPHLAQSRLTALINGIYDARECMVQYTKSLEVKAELQKSGKDATQEALAARLERIGRARLEQFGELHVPPERRRLIRDRVPLDQINPIEGDIPEDCLQALAEAKPPCIFLDQPKKPLDIGFVKRVYARLAREDIANSLYDHVATGMAEGRLDPNDARVLPENAFTALILERLIHIREIVVERMGVEAYRSRDMWMAYFELEQNKGIASLLTWMRDSWITALFEHYLRVPEYTMPFFAMRSAVRDLRNLKKAETFYTAAEKMAAAANAISRPSIGTRLGRVQRAAEEKDTAAAASANVKKAGEDSADGETVPPAKKTRTRRKGPAQE